MRFTLTALLLLTPALSFVPTQGPLRATFLRSTVEKTETEVPVESGRFEKLRKRYKGPTRAVDTSDVSFSYEEFTSLLPTHTPSFARNDIVPGTTITHANGGIMIDIGAKANAFCPAAEISLVPEEGPESVPLEAERKFQIISEEDENGQLLVSLRRIAYRAAWDSVAALAATDTVFDAVVQSVNRGGAICVVDGLRAFLPGSHLVGHMPTEELVGVTLPLKFLEVNQDANKLVVSNRRAIVDASMSNLSRGDVVSGIVKALKPYGAFVEVGGMSGLLHISQISYDRIDDLPSVLAIGDNVKCMIIDHDKVNGRIALSTKTLEPEPGDMLRSSQKVFDLADQTAAKYHARMEAERRAREDAAKDIVLGLGDGAGDGGAMADVDDSLESALGEEKKAE